MSSIFWFDSIKSILELVIFSSWKSSILVFLVLLVQWCFRRWISPQWRFALWTIVILKLLIPISFESKISIFQKASQIPEQALSSSFRATIIPEDKFATQNQSAQTTLIKNSSSNIPSTLEHAIPDNHWNLLQWFGIIWFIGVLGLSFFVVRRNWLLKRTFLDLLMISNKKILLLFENVRNEMRIHRPVLILESANIKSPILTGLFYPKLILPKGLIEDLTVAELRFIFLHELTHLKRGDIALNWLFTFLQIIHWFNPILWIAFWRMRLDRELACDEAVLSHSQTGESENYGHILVRLAERISNTSFLPGTIGILEHGKDLSQRLSYIIGFKRRSTLISFINFACLVFLSYICLAEAQSSIPSNARVHLTLDPQIQNFVEESMKNVKGAAIVMNPQTGDILAMVSTPSSKKLSSELSNEEWKSLLDNPKTSSIQRALTAYPPGSTFKVLVALAALKNKVITDKSIVECAGGMDLERFHFNCWQKDGHGDVDLNLAITESCNIFFYQTGIRTGLKNISTLAENVGFGQSTELINGEDPGFVPTERWLKAHPEHPQWTDGDSMNISVGQGLIKVTPLQQAIFMSSIANGGNIYYPRLLDSITDSNGKIIERIPSKKVHTKLDVDPSDLELVRQSLLSAVEGDGGTGQRAKIPNMKIAGKTGSAQSSVKNKPCVWFCGFAPFENPQYAFCIFVEGGVSGGSTAAPIAHEFLSKIFEKVHQNN